MSEQDEAVSTPTTNQTPRDTMSEPGDEAQVKEPDKELAKPPAKRPRTLSPWEEACLSSIKSSDMTQCKRIKSRLESLLSKADKKIDMLQKIEEMMNEDNGGFESDSLPAVAAAVPARKPKKKKLTKPRTFTKSPPKGTGQISHVTIPASTAHDLISCSIQNGQLYNVQWAISDNGTRQSTMAKQLEALLSPITPSMLKMKFGNRSVLFRYTQSVPMAPRRRSMERPHDFVAFQGGTCCVKGCESMWVCGFTEEALIDLTKEEEVISLGLWMDIKCQHECSKGGNLGDLLSGDGGLMGNDVPVEEIAEEGRMENNGNNIRDLVLRRRVYTAFYKASILSLRRQATILKAYAEEMGIKFMSYGGYADWLNGVRKSERPLKDDYWNVMNSFILLVDEGRIDEIRELAVEPVE